MPVQCKNCHNLFRRSFCQAKEIEVKRNKSIECELFEPRQKRAPVEPIYVPSVDKKTRRIIRKLIEAGVLPIVSDGEVRPGPARSIEMEMPQTTATAGVINAAPKNPPSSLGSAVEPGPLEDNLDANP